MDYSHEFGSNFPQEVIPIGTKKDIDDSVKELVMNYYSLMDSGNLSEATVLYNNNKDILEPYDISARYFNRLEEDMYNLGVALLNGMSTIVSDTEPTSQSIDSHWLQEY